jgi:hypothetical protein
MLKKIYRDNIINDLLKCKSKIAECSLKESDFNFSFNLKKVLDYIDENLNILSNDYESLDLIENKIPQLSIYYDKQNSFGHVRIFFEEHTNLHLSKNNQNEINEIFINNVFPIDKDNDAFDANLLKIKYSNLGQARIIFPKFSNSLILFDFKFYDSNFYQNLDKDIYIDSNELYSNMLNSNFLIKARDDINFYEKFTKFNRYFKLELIDKCLQNFKF